MRCADSTFELAIASPETTASLHQTTETQRIATELLPITTMSPHKPASLVDLPLEILCMIFDYAACRDHHKNPRYLIQSKERRSSGHALVISQPALLMVCSSLRSALSQHFYSSCSFHAKIGTGSMMDYSASRLRLQQIEDKLPYPLSLSTIQLTIELCDLIERGFDLSILVKLGERLFIEYRAMKLSSSSEVKLRNLPWRFVWTDKSLCNPVNESLNADLQLLLEAVHKISAESAITQSDDLQKFNSSMERWLRKPQDFKDSTYRVRILLRGLYGTPMYLSRVSKKWRGL